MGRSQDEIGLKSLMITLLTGLEIERRGIKEKKRRTTTLKVTASKIFLHNT
jgi:hypothetical protein